MVVGAVLGAAAAVAAGVVSLVIARHAPDGAFAGRSLGDGVLELSAGWSVALAGVLFTLRRRNRCGLLLLGAGSAWFLVEWSNPGSGSSLAFTIGLIGVLACAPVVAHVALVHPSGRPGTSLERLAVGAGYASTIGLLGLLPVLVFDPGAEGCADCPPNLALVRGDAGTYEAFVRWGLRLTLCWALVAAGAALWRVWRSRDALIVTAAVPVAGAVYLSLVAFDVWHSLRRNGLGNDAVDIRIWRLEGAALIALAAGVVWRLAFARRARSLVAGLVLELGHSQRPGGVRDALADALDDPSLQVAYRAAGSAEYGDAGRAVTELMHEGRPVAAVIHDPALLRDPGLVEEAVAAARLAIENERFELEMNTQLERLRASRARIVATGDAERRRLERDLHDGAQQRLVGLLLALRMVRGEVAPTEQSKVDDADAEVRRALADLRTLAQGIFPAALADEGLAAAVELLVDHFEADVQIRGLPSRRFAPAVETAAYLVIAETLDRTRPPRAEIEVSLRGEELIVEVWAAGRTQEPFTDLEDRVGALGGVLTVVLDDRTRVRAELPCA